MKHTNADIRKSFSGSVGFRSLAIVVVIFWLVFFALFQSGRRVVNADSTGSNVTAGTTPSSAADAKKPRPSFMEAAMGFFGFTSEQVSGSVASTDVFSPSTVSTNIGDVAVNVGNAAIKKLSAVNGTVLWSASVTNEGALAVDPVDLGVYTGNGSHFSGGSGTAYKFDAGGILAWTSLINRPGTCNFYYVSDVAVDSSSSSPGAIWTEKNCFGGMAKTDRYSGTQQWSVFTNDIGRASIDPANGSIFTTTVAGPGYAYDSLYSASSAGSLVSAASCEGYTDINPADGMLYRGGKMASNGCGLMLSQINKSTLGVNWSMNLTGFISSFDSLAIQPSIGGYIYAGSISSSRIVVIDPAAQAVVTMFTTAVAPASIAVNPNGGNVYITDGIGNFVYAYSPVGSLVWTSPNLGGIAYNVAAPRSIVPAAPIPSVGDVAANVANNRLYKLNAANGNVLWTAAVPNDGALAVDQLDYGVYTGLGGHNAGPTAVYKYNASGTLAWTGSLGPASGCNFYYVGNAAVDTSSGSPGVVWTQGGCNGYIAKSNRTTGAQQWSLSTNDLGRATIDPVNGQIYSITNASPSFSYNTIYSTSATGSGTSASSCEGYTDLNPADGMLYRGGNMASNGCGNTLYQIDKTTLAANWSMNLSAYITSFNSLAVQPWTGGYIYVGSVASNKIVVVNPATLTVVRTFTTAVSPASIAVNPNGGNVYVTDSMGNFVYAYRSNGSLVWTSPNLGGTVYSVSAPRDTVGLAPTAATVSVSGRVLTSDGSGLRNAVVVLTDMQGVTRTALSSPFGYYRVDNVQAGETYVIGVSSKRYQFTPRTVTVNDELTDFVLIAESGMRSKEIK